MRRKYFGLALAAIATLTPAYAFAGDREIAEQIIQNLKADRDAGNLKDFTLDMKVDAGVVLFRGNVSADQQKQIVLAAADGVQGIAKIVDEVSVAAAVPQQQTAPQPSVAKPTVAKPKAHVATAAKSDDSFSFREALAQTAEAIRRSEAKNDGESALTSSTELPIPVTVEAPEEQLPLQADSTVTPMPGEVLQTGSLESVGDSDQEISRSVMNNIAAAQDAGRLKGFGVKVTSVDGVVELVGKASSEAQRDMLVQIADQTPGVRGVHESIDIFATVRPVSNLQNLNLKPAGSPAPAAVTNAPYRMNQGGSQGMTQATPVSTSGMVGAPVMGQPVPMAPYGGAATPRYEQPYLPNYAWPGYAAYPNYAAVSYPQQYSPSAFPYIGPFYPYPQVPLGWRKVSLEWDDGWWYLDFTDR